MTNGDRIIASCDRWLTEGPLADKSRADAYRRLISCGFDPPLEDFQGHPLKGADIGTIKTSCAVFARGILHDSGVLPARRRGRSGQGMWHGWLGELSTNHRAWVHFKEGMAPPRGALAYIQSPVNPNNNHVLFFLEPIQASNMWRVAQGGGGDGTRCAFSTTQATLWHGNRNLLGWFDPELIGAAAEPVDSDEEITKPEVPAPVRLLRRSIIPGPDIAEWQHQLARDGWCVPPTGEFDFETDAATRKWQASRGLKPDGVVGPLTRAKIGQPPTRQSSTQMRAVKPDGTT